MLSSSQFRQKSKKTLFNNLLNDICQLDNENEVVDEREDTLFLEWCNKITELDSDEFAEFDEQLCVYLIRDWAKSSCFRSLTFLTDVISFICSIADIQIVEEHLSWFSQPSMPPHVHLVVYPALLTVANKRRPNGYLPDSDDTFNFKKKFENLMLKLSQENSAEDISKLAEAKEVIHFWKDTLNHYFVTYDSEEFDRKLFSAFLCYHSYFQITFKSHNPRLDVMQILFKSLNKKHKKEKSLVLSSLFILFIKSIKITSVVQWKAIKLFLDKINLTASEQSNENLKNFVSKSIQTFTQYVDIFDESLLDEFVMSSKTDNSKSTCNVNDGKMSKDAHKQISQQDLNSDTKENVNSKTILKTTVDQNQFLDKFLDALEKLVDKLQSSKFQLNTSAQRNRLKHQIANLNQFL